MENDGKTPVQRTARPRRPARGVRQKIRGRNEMDMAEEYLEPPLRDENLQICPNCGAEFNVPGESEYACPDCGQKIKQSTGALDEWGRLHPRKE